jgi:murein DD-endopeptidase MepM/ murein hydrolase activator NlpD
LHSHAAAHQVRHGLHSIVAASRLFPTRQRRAAGTWGSTRTAHRSTRTLLGRLGPDRAVAVAVAGILIGASVVSVTAGRAAPNTGGPTGDGPASRITVGGGAAGAGAATNDGSSQTGSVEFGEPDPTLDPIDEEFAFVTLSEDQIEPEAPISVEGPFIDDGTLLKPVAVDTTVPDGRDLVKTYKVKAGDTLVGIASKYDVSMMTVWWANDLKSKDDLKVGQVLRIPPVTGLIVKVTAQDTLEGVAARYGVTGTDILATNGLTDSNLVVGQVLVVPGAKGKAIPVPVKPPVKTPTKSSSSGSSSVRTPSTYTGGKFTWPVVGGGNYISQYFHYGHYALDIAADYGSTARAAASGTVTFAGWKSNGGGYQVWIAHGSGLYTTYNHMSAVSVGVGQEVSRGQHVGRVGQSGNASGPHLHFEVWRGAVWDGGRRVNPLAYL